MFKPEYDNCYYLKKNNYNYIQIYYFFKTLWLLLNKNDRTKEKGSTERIMGVCQEDCDFSEYNYDTFVAECSCKVKESSDSFADMNIDKSKLLKNFKNIKNIVNFDFLKCYKKLFNKEGILNNLGCYLILLIILFSNNNNYHIQV